MDVNGRHSRGSGNCSSSSSIPRRNGSEAKQHTTVYSVISTLDDASTPEFLINNRGNLGDSDRHQYQHTSLLQLQTIRNKMEYKFVRVFRNRSIIVDILAICFGIGTWIGVNGTFIQLPLLVAEAPEGWSLPSYLGVMVQIGNLGPLLYTSIQKFSKRKMNDAHIIYVVLAIGTIVCLLTAFFFNKTSIVFGQEHSVALFILTIFTAFNACTSSVLFMPYMGRFREKYLVTYFIGEGLSGLLPSVVALIQGVGSSECKLVNVTESDEQIFERHELPPRFGTQLFFVILFVLMVCSYVGYTLLDRLKLARREYANVTVQKGNNYVYEKKTEADAIEASDKTINEPEDSYSKLITRNQYYGLLMLITIISFFSNGMFGSIQSYSTLPYGELAYHLSATLSVIANPVACFLAMFMQFKSLRLLTAISVAAALLTAYVFMTAVLSPYPPMYDSTVGSVLVITAWTLLYGFVSFAKLCITTVMRSQGGTSLVWVGGLTQLGSAIGAVLIFVCINFTSYFQSAQFTC